MLPRRSLLVGALGSLFSPALIKSGVLMPASTRLLVRYPEFMLTCEQKVDSSVLDMMWYGQKISEAFGIPYSLLYGTQAPHDRSLTQLEIELLQSDKIWAERQ